MMEKMLHERLREYVDRSREDFCYPTVVALKDDCECGANHDAECDLLLSWADEIERSYLPLPRFEDGEPVKIGDKIKCLTGIGTVDDIEVTANGLWRIYSELGHILCNGYGNTYYVTRPGATDANDEEIKPGDTVYGINDGFELTVDDVYRSVCGYWCFYATVNGHQAGYIASRFTHEKPDTIESIIKEMKEYDGDMTCDIVNSYAHRIEQAIKREQEGERNE